MDLLNPEQFSAAEQRKKPQQLLTVLLTALHYHAVLPHRMVPGGFYSAL